MQFTCGGKVFIVGEYACLQGGPSLLATVGPRFSLTVSNDTAKQHTLPFAEESPAGRYSLASKGDEFLKLDWQDPYETPIGVGSSSAQFLLTVAALTTLRGEPLPPASQILRKYWEVVGDSQGLRPSGVDVVAQWQGGPLVVSNEPFSARALSPWRGNASFWLAYTGTKAKTHEHLKALQKRGFPTAFENVFSHLNKITLNTVNSWSSQDPLSLGRCLNAYQVALDEAGLAAREFNTNLIEIQRWPGVFGAKGTGAQGGDCCLLLIDDAEALSISRRIKALGWQPIQMEFLYEGVRKR